MVRFNFKKRIEKVIDCNLINKESYLSAMERSPVNDLEIRYLLTNALTESINNREIYMKGTDVSYYLIRKLT